MQKDLERKLNNFKKIKASNDWKADLKSELFQEEEHFLLQIVQPKLAFGSLVMAGLALALIVVGTANEYPPVEMVENKIDHRVMTAVENMQAEDEVEDKIGMMAMEEPESEEVSPLTADLEFDQLSEKEQRDLVRQSTEELLAELDEVEERIVRVLGSNN